MSLLVVLSIVQVGIGTAGASAGTITSCQEISSPGSYSLGEALTGANDNPDGRTSCIHISADGVTLDGAGYRIGDIADTGILVTADDVTVENVVVENVNDAGIEFIQATNGRIASNEIRAAGKGILVTDGRDHVLASNTIDGTVDHGVHIRQHSTGNEVRGNAITNNGRSGIMVETGASGTEIRNNDLTDNSENGVEVITDDNRILNNRIENNGLSGVRVDTALRNEIANNQIVQNGEHGVNLDVSDDTTIRGNTIEDSGFAGIYLYRSNGTMIVEDNVLTYNVNGIEIVSSTENQIRNTTLRNNGNGTYLRASHTNGIFHNDINENDEYGLVFVSDAGYNYITNNSAVDNGIAAYYASGDSPNYGTNLRIGDADNPTDVGFTYAAGVIINTTGPPPDGPDPNWTPEPTAESGGMNDGGVSPETVAADPSGGVGGNASERLTETRQQLAEHMNVSEKTRMGQYVRVQPVREPAPTEPEARFGWLRDLTIYYEDADLGCINESTLRLWAYESPSDPDSTGAWRTAIASYSIRDQKSASRSGASGAGFAHHPAAKYVKLKRIDLSFNFIDYYVFAPLGDPKSGCTPSPGPTVADTTNSGDAADSNAPDVETTTPGFGMSVAILALIVVAFRRLRTAS